MDPLPRIVGHGGLYGALGELGVVLVVGLPLTWVWWRERRRRLRAGNPPARMRE